MDYIAMQRKSTMICDIKELDKYMRNNILNGKYTI